MRVAVVAGCEIRVHWLFVAVMLGAALSGYLTIYLLSFALVLLHEGSHALAARAHGLRVREIELLPFGGVARIEGLFELDPSAEFLIAAAGPACNLLLYMSAVTLHSFFPLPEARYRLFLDANLGITALNLLPALPLDGGRMLRGLLARHFDAVKVTKACAVTGIAASALLAALFLWAAFQGVMNFSVLLMAVFLCLASWREFAQAPWMFYRGFTGKKASLRREQALPVRQIIARRDMPLGKLARRFSPGCYHFITVVDEDCRRLGTLDEEQVVEALMSGGAEMEAVKLLTGRAV